MAVFKYENWTVAYIDEQGQLVADGEWSHEGGEEKAIEKWNTRI